jgi:hypothetical protein
MNLSCVVFYYDVTYFLFFHFFLLEFLQVIISNVVMFVEWPKIMNLNLNCKCTMFYGA